MDEIVQLSELIGDIYDAALDPDKWEHVLEKTCNFIEGAAGGIGLFDLRPNQTNLSKSWGYDPKYLQSFVERYSKINPAALASLRTEVGDVCTNSDLLPFHEWQGGRSARASWHGR
jgi:hypothetical protein